MDITEEIENLLTTIKLLSKDGEEYIKPIRTISYPELTSTTIANDIIDVSKIDFGDDETWLCKPESDSRIDLHAWLSQDTEVVKDLDFHSNHLALMREITKLESAKKIDSRTFTRPKKRFNRPSLDFVDPRFSISEFTHNNFIDKELDLCEKPLPTPLNFDFSEPTSNIFTNIKNDSGLDSFQNMSPPSLVSSSIFSSIMENSYIKNDPVLREIRDTDYTDVILQGCDQSLLKSFTGSCSSVDSDTPEGFLKRSVESTFIKNDKNASDILTENNMNETFITNNTVVFNLNTTFQKESKENNTYPFMLNEQGPLDTPNSRSSNKSSSILSNTYRRKTPKQNLNDTFSIITHNDNENMKNEDLNRTIVISDEKIMDSNRLNYSNRRSCIIEDTKCDLKYNTFLKRNRRSLGSTDSLDCASSLSTNSSGKGSSKMLNMAEVDAIVLQQEQTLQQVMSTPKPLSNYTDKLPDYSNISPIRQLGHESDSDEDYLTVDSGSSKSLTSGSANSDPALLNIPNNLKSITNKIANNVIKNEIPKKQTNLNRNLQYGSYSNLHKAKLMAQQGSQKNLATGNAQKAYTQSNLKTMDTKLKGSYTQLKPVFTNLPSTVPPVKTISNVNKPKVSETPLKIAEVTPTLREQFKPPPPPVVKASGLPRPVSGIPRPAGSKIPGPLSNRSGIPLSRPTSKININTDF